MALSDRGREKTGAIEVCQHHATALLTGGDVLRGLQCRGHNAGAPMSGLHGLVLDMSMDFPLDVFPVPCSL